MMSMYFTPLLLAVACPPGRSPGCLHRLVRRRPVILDIGTIMPVPSPFFSARSGGTITAGAAVGARPRRRDGDGTVRQVTRRQAVALLGAGALLTADSGSGAAAPWYPPGGTGYAPDGTGYAPDGTAGARTAYPLAAVRLLESPFRSNQLRNLDYLLFLDPDRMLHTFRLNYDRPSAARPCEGWEAPDIEVRGHTTGHLLSGLALSYASTGDPRAKAAGEYLVGQLAQLQAIAPSAGYAPGYLSAFPEYFFDWLEAGQRVWSPYYMIHKYLAGLIDSYELAGVGQALDVAIRLADWVDARTARLSYPRMQRVLENEFGGLPESLANLYRITGEERYLTVAQRFY